MGYMKRNINFGLLALLLGMIMVFIGFTLYYQQTFNTLASNYTTKLSQLEKVTQELSKHKSILTVTKTELNQTEIDVAAISVDYEELVDAKTAVEGELATTEANLNTKISELNAEKKLTRELNTEITAKEADILKWKGLYNAEVVESQEWEDKFNACDNDLDDCEDDLATWPGACT